MPVKFILAIAGAILIGACASQPQTRVVQLTAEFDEKAARTLIDEGENTLSGHAFVNRGDGGFVTCAGALVELIPATEYAKERMTHIYGSGETGTSSTGVFVFEPDPPEYAIVRRATTCDDHGTFKFEAVADGTFYLVTGVWWEDADQQPDQQPGEKQGANLMRRVTIEDGDKQDVVLTRAAPSALDRALDAIRQMRPPTSGETE